MKKRWLTLAVVLAACAAWGEMVILIQDVETPTTRASQGKYLDVKTKQMIPQDSALTEADRATLDPESLGQIREQEIRDGMRDRQMERDNIERDNRRRQEIADLLRQEAISTEAGRNIIQAKDWIGGALSPYRDIIQVIDRADMDFQMDETARNEEAQHMYGGVTHLLRVIVGDLKTATTTAESYGVKTVMKKKTLNVSVAISDLYGRQVFSESFTGVKSDVATSYGGTTDGDDHGDLLRDALQQAGAAIGKAFGVRLTVEVAGPKGDTDFDAAYAIVRVDGLDRAAGEEITLLKGRHVIEVELDGYQPVEQTVTLSSDLTRRIALAKVSDEAGE